MKKNTLEFLETHQSETPSKWREEAEWRRENWSWLQHSQRIAVKVLLEMKLQGPTQKALAERMHCTQQYVSKILKGKENMSLDTLTRLENALGISLILDSHGANYASYEEETMDETEYLMSSPAMADILRQGEEDMKNGLGRVIKLEDIWK